MSPTEIYTLTIVLNNGVARTFEMLNADALDSALSSFLDTYPRPQTIALQLKSDYGEKSADVVIDRIFALEYERPLRDHERAGE